MAQVMPEASQLSQSPKRQTSNSSRSRATKAAATTKSNVVNNTISMTRDIVVGFMRNSLEQRGYEEDWRQPEEENQTKNKNKNNNNSHGYNQEELVELCQILTRISTELQDYIKRTQEDRLQEMSNELLEDFHYDAFRTLADELFFEKIVWYRIVTLLAYGAECACRAIETRDSNSDENEAQVMVSQIVDWMCKYIDENLSQWIGQQEGGWLSLKNSELARVNSSSNEDQQRRNQPRTISSRNLRHYFSVAAVSVFIGSLYLCSKFSIQK